MLQRVAINLAFNTFTSIEFYLNLSIEEFVRVAEEISEVSKKHG